MAAVTIKRVLGPAWHMSRSRTEREATASWNLELMRLCARVGRCCARMNSGLDAATVVLAATTLFVSVLRVSDEITRDGQHGQLPFIDMATDGPTTGINR